MKIAIESNDGKTIKSPLSKTKGYLVFDVDDANIMGPEYRRKHNKRRTVKSGKAKPLLCDCGTIISRGMDREALSKMKKKGLDVFITFNTHAQDALRAYLKERLINEQLIHRECSDTKNIN
ncbi:hypothetical protein BMS3Abin03_00534 [bacterium BMS3Abin03]|nr:hypothetical protein BMS3Abin03_00534 [bacterium BMS3Abin03]